MELRVENGKLRMNVSAYADTFKFYRVSDTLILNSSPSYVKELQKRVENPDFSEKMIKIKFTTLFFPENVV